MTVTINGTTGYSGPVGTIGDLTTTGNTTLGDASGDTLTINGSTTTLTQGTANGVAYLNGSKALTTGSALVFDGTNLGIGTSSPSTQLHLYKNAASASQVTIENASSSAGSYATVQFNAGTVTSQLFSDAAGGVYSAGAVLRTTSNHPLIFGTNSTERTRIDTSGNLLVGTTTARNKLTVQGTIFSVPTLGTASGNAFFGEASGYGLMMGTSGYGYGWIQQQRVDGTATAYDLCLQPVGGSVLVGTTTAVEKITVTSGSIRTTSDNSCIVNGNDANLGFVKKAGFDGHLTASSASPMIFSRLNQTTITSATVAAGTLSEFARFDTSGRMGIGYSAPNAQLVVCGGGGSGWVAGARNTIQLRNVNSSSNQSCWIAFGSAASESYCFIGNDINANGTTVNQLNIQAGSSGGVYLANGGTSWTAVSDERYKDIIAPITDATSKVSALRAVIGKYKADADGVRRSFLIAQDVKAVLPEAVTIGEDAQGNEQLGLSYSDVMPLLVAAIKELKADFDAYKLTHP